MGRRGRPLKQRVACKHCTKVRATSTLCKICAKNWHACGQHNKPTEKSAVPKVLRICAKLFGVKFPSKVFSKDSVNRAVVEAGLAVDYGMAKLLPQLKYLFVGVDESSKVDGRSFVEVEFGGFKEKQPGQGKKVFFLMVVKEVLGHTAQDLCTLILECLQDIQAKQQELGLSLLLLHWT
ncbi:hypothetical protein QOT17_003092 [Balamuthia mandrillaris]